MQKQVARIFIYVQTFFGSQTNAEESFNSIHPLAWTEQEILHRIVSPPCKHISKPACPQIEIAITMNPNSSG